ncbi:MAG TPA: hypothetical protein DC047_08605 [Blastocatellia bacterium]|nr:hypothetical protein [Blastocatellia bacterium]
MPKAPLFKKEILIGVSFLILIPLLAHWLFSWMGFTPTDEGFTLAYSRRLLDGQVPHRDFIIIRPFLSPLIHVPFVFFGGAYTFWLSRLFVWFQLACISWCWVLIINRTMKFPFSPGQAFLAAIISFAATAHSKHLTAWHTIDGLFFIAIGLVLCIKGRQIHKLLGYFLLGLAPLCKQSFIFVVPLSLLILNDWRQVKYWIAAVLPGLAYVGYLISAHAFFDALFQLTSRTEFLSAGLLQYLSKRVALSFTVGYLSLWLILGRFFRSESIKKWIAILMLYGVPLLGTAGSLWFGVLAGTSLGLFGILAGAAAYLLTTNSGPQTWKRISLLVLAVAWSASISGGYKTPALMSGPILLVLTAHVFSLQKQQRALHYSFIIASLLIALSFGVARTRYIYRDLPATQLTKSLDEVLPGARHIKTNPNTFDFMRDLNEAVKLVEAEHKRFAILPDVAAYWVKAGQQNPLPAVWPHADELSTTLLMDRFVGAMEASRADTIFIVQKVEAKELARGFVPLPSNEYYYVVGYARSHFVKVHETNYFELYK